MPYDKALCVMWEASTRAMAFCRAQVARILLELCVYIIDDWLKVVHAVWVRQLIKRGDTFNLYPKLLPSKPICVYITFMACIKFVLIFES